MRDAHPKTTRERVLDLLVPLGSPMHAWLQDLLTWLDDATRARELGTRPNPLYRERVIDLLHAAEPTVCLAAALVHVEALEAELAAAREPAELVADPPLADDDAVDVRHVTRAGAESFVSGYHEGQRGLVALHFAADDLAGWAWHLCSRTPASASQTMSGMRGSG